MADDILARMAQMQAMSGSTGKPGRLLGILGDVDIGQGLSLRAVSLDKPICQLSNSFQNRRGKGSAMENAIQAAMQQFSKAASEAGVIYSGNVTNGPPTSGLGGMGRGGGFELE